MIPLVRSLTIALFLSCAASALPAAAPALTLPPKITGQPGAFISVPATTNGKNVSWFPIDPGLNLFPVALLKDTHTAVVTSGTPGTYRLLAITAAGDEISAPAVCQIVIEGTPPPAPPTPQPNPTPAPNPPPATKTAWAIVVVDNSKRTPAVGQLITSPALLQSLRKAGVHFVALDVNDPRVVNNHYDAAVADAGGAPALLVYDAGGKRIKAVPLPADSASFLAALPGAAARAALCTCGANCACAAGKCPSDCPASRQTPATNCPDGKCPL